MTLQELSRNRNWMKGKLSQKLSGREIYNLTIGEHEVYKQIEKLQLQLLESWDANSKEMLNTFKYWEIVAP